MGPLVVITQPGWSGTTYGLKISATQDEDGQTSEFHLALVGSDHFGTGFTYVNPVVQKRVIASVANDDEVSRVVPESIWSEGTTLVSELVYVPGVSEKAKPQFLDTAASIALGRGDKDTDIHSKHKNNFETPQMRKVTKKPVHIIYHKMSFGDPYMFASMHSKACDSPL